MNEKCEREGFVGVHIGAGQHSEARTKLYLDICAAACQAGVDVLREGGSALDAAERATIILEDAGETNAGFGSNLTESGTLEMDAGLMDGSTLLFGAVGAITEIKNPIMVARKLVDEQAKGLLPLGRVPPGFLVGEGAKEWAIRHGIQSVSSDHLISEKAAKLYKHYKKKLDTYKLSLESNKRKKEDVSEVDCKRLRIAQKLSMSEHVRSNDGATKLVDGNSIDFEEAAQIPQVLRRNDEISLEGGIPLESNISFNFSGIGRLGCRYSGNDSAHSSLENTLPNTTPPTYPLPSHKFTHRYIPQPNLEVENLTGDNHDAISAMDSARPVSEYDDKVQDTVGVVVLDARGNVAASVSSGGIALKQSGRVGQASCYGCGCWAQRALKQDSSSVAVSTTGCGEHLVRTLLAKECGQGLSNTSTPMESLQLIMKEKFAESEFLEGINEKLGGAICMQYNKNCGRGTFLWTHTTASMGIGFQTTAEDEATVKMSRLPKSSNNQGTTILVESVSFDTRSAAFKQ